MSDIYGFLGRMGCGKTMLQTAVGTSMSIARDKPIASNYALKKIDYIPLSTIESIENCRNCVMLLDELWLWLFSRVSQTKVNKALNKIVMLNRKRNVDILYTAQLSRSIDVMVREVTSRFFYPYIVVHKANGGYKQFFVKFVSTDPSGFRRKSAQLKQNTEYWGSFYDTTEEIGAISKESIPLERGMVYERLFFKALRSIKKFNRLKLLDRSGINSGWAGDIVAYNKKGSHVFDVKSTGKRDVNLEVRNLAKQKKDSENDGAKLYLAFPKINSNVVNLGNKNYWFIHRVNDNSYLLKLSGNNHSVFYNKLKNNSVPLVDYDFK